jgi:hypothetical protein
LYLRAFVVKFVVLDDPGTVKIGARVNKESALLSLWLHFISREGESTFETSADNYCRFSDAACARFTACRTG